MNKARVSLPDDWQPSGHLLRDSVMGLVPESLEPYIAINKTLWFDGPLSAAELELMRLRNARHVGCVYCKATRYDIARDAGLDEYKIGKIDDYANSDMSTREKLILRYTDVYLDNPEGLSEALQTEMAKEFSKEDIIHLSLALILFNTMSRAAVCFGGMPEHELPAMAIAVPE
jgi:alkylhydroperoxidase family enzyme